MPCHLPDLEETEHYTKIPFQFTEELSSKNVYVKLPGEFSPLERMILQATGNLQRLLSAYYNAPSHVEIVRNDLNENGHGNSKAPSFEREIRMYFNDRVVYTAQSSLIVKNQEILPLLEVHKYGLGQIFGHTKRTPDFVLHAVGRHGKFTGASFWRDYSLTIPDELDCFIREIFVQDLFEPSHEEDPDRTVGTIWTSKS